MGSLRRAIAALLVASIGLAACGGRPVFEERPPGDPAASLGLPEPIAAAPAYVVTAKRPLAGSRLRALERTTGVAVAAPVRMSEVRVIGPSGAARLTVGAVDALQFRSVAPGPTRDAEFVWTSLLTGGAVLTSDAATKLGTPDGGRIRLPGYGELGVGALADNGAPNVVDVLVDISVGQAIGLDQAHLVVVGAHSGVVLERLGEDITRRVPGARLERLSTVTGPAPTAVTQPTGYAQGALIGSMRFVVLEDGAIAPDPAWVEANIAAGEVPILGSVTCHRLVFPQLRAALTEVIERGLADAIRTRDFGGCYVPRFIDRDPSKPLSMHAFGLALDLNTTTNRLGSSGDMDPRIVAIFDRWGFAWGGRWARPDPMHFELARVLQP